MFAVCQKKEVHMVKKILIALILVIALVFGLYWLKNHFDSYPITKTPVPIVVQTAFNDKTYTYTPDTLGDTCEMNSEMACAVDFAVKCTINPDYNGCRQSKLPKFIFMSDEALQRPTEISFKITKIKPIAADLVEIHTDSSCNGNWFGLCQGNVIYVLVPNGESWRVKDIYAIEKQLLKMFVT